MAIISTLFCSLSLILKSWLRPSDKSNPTKGETINTKKLTTNKPLMIRPYFRNKKDQKILVPVTSFPTV